MFRHGCVGDPLMKKNVSFIEFYFQVLSHCGIKGRHYDFGLHIGA